MAAHGYSRAIRRADIEDLIEALIGFLDAVDAPHEDREDEIGDTGFLLVEDAPSRPMVMATAEDVVYTRASKAYFPGMEEAK